METVLQALRKENITACPVDIRIEIAITNAPKI
jgi:hypothetical protein